jgi:hypothetical protein
MSQHQLLPEWTVSYPAERFVVVAAVPAAVGLGEVAYAPWHIGVARQVAGRHNALQVVWASDNAAAVGTSVPAAVGQHAERNFA